MIIKQTKKTIKLSLWALALSLGQSFAQDASTPVSVVNAMSPVTEEKGEEKELQEITTIGTRTAPRINVSSSLPIDNFLVRDLTSTGQPTFDKAMQYRVPSFNTVNTPVNDATAFIDPWEIRNMGPSRTLVLINGKRKNTSSLLMLQYSPSRGESGVDISAIPQDAIKSIEFLRDGASAQYGSDAIAGVINIKLKDKFDYTSLNLQSGITSKGDGLSYSIALNSGANFGNKGFVNYTAQFQQLQTAVRNGDVSVDDDAKLWGAEFFRNTLPVQLQGGTNTNEQFSKTKIASFLSKYKSGGGTTNGTGDITMAKFLINAGIPINATTQLYANAAVVSKQAKNNAFYRMTYWPGAGTFNNGFGFFNQADGSYQGFMPTFEGNLLDYNGTIGVANNVENGWNTDVSLTVGGNTQDYTVNNSMNPSMGFNSPTSFKPGGYGFHHLVGNIDINRNFGDMWSVGFGAEARTEIFQIMAGDTASYYKAGAQSFTGMDIKDAKTNSRNNFGMYASLDFTPSKEFILNGTVRYEKYSDFGDAFVWKLSSRYTLTEGLSIRASASTGFKAPSLHQIYQQGRFSTFVPGQGVDLARLYNNADPITKKLGIPSLKAENSLNYTAGVVFSPSKNFTISLDYYYIQVKDRIVMTSILQDTSEVPTLVGNSNTQINGAWGGVFFINGVNTINQGLDFVATYKNIALGTGKMAINLAGNITLENKLDGDVATPQATKNAGIKIFNLEASHLLTTSRPAQKIILGIDYSIQKLHFNLSNTYFGKTQFVHDAASGDLITGPIALMEKGIVQEFSPAIVTDLSVGYAFSPKVSVNFTINNLLNVLPKWDLVATTAEGQKLLDGKTDNGLAPVHTAYFDESVKDYLKRGITMSNRFPITGKNGSQFSQLGTQFFLSLTFKL